MAFNVLNLVRSLASVTAQAGNVTATGGAEGEQLAAEVHGKWYHRAKAGQLFIGSTALAGTTIPVNAANLVSTFTLVNPVGSGVNLELARYKVGVAGTTTAVIGGLALVGQSAYSSSVFVTPTSQTVLTPRLALYGSAASGSSKALLLAAGTLTGTPEVVDSLGISFGTTGAQPGPVSNVYDFDGHLVLVPGSLITVVSTAAQTQPMQQSFVWAEVPPT